MSNTIYISHDRCH